MAEPARGGTSVHLCLRPIADVRAIHGTAARGWPHNFALHFSLVTALMLFQVLGSSPTIQKCAFRRRHDRAEHRTLARPPVPLPAIRQPTSLPKSSRSAEDREPQYGWSRVGTRLFV